MCIVVGLLFIGIDATRHIVRWYLVAWVAFITLAFGKLPWASLPLRHPLPTWLSQVVIVTSGVALAVGPFISQVRDQAGSKLPPSPEASHAAKSLLGK